MKIAVEGCAHGQLEKIYEVLTEIEARESFKIDLLICCGDFQATRNKADLATMSIPPKYQDICTFYKYYSGEKTAPIPTIFIGGNHEASNYLQELPYGGWVAPNIYYLGYAGVININGIRIGGLSGIYKGQDYFRGHYEFAPYTESSKRSVYHTRQLEIFRLKQISGEIDIFISHDWPRGIYHFGNHKQLLRFKPHFRDDIENNRLGSPPCQALLDCLKPTYWFAAHLHCQFPALVPHPNSQKFTKFLALDKCLPKRRFLQILEIDNANIIKDARIKFEYDLEWLTILSLTNHLISSKKTFNYMPGPNGKGRHDYTPTIEEKELIHAKFDYDLTIPSNFRQTAVPYNANDYENQYNQPQSKINPQTAAFCTKLCIDDPLVISMLLAGKEPKEYPISNDSDDDTDTVSKTELGNRPFERLNPEEINVSEDDSTDNDDLMEREVKFGTECFKITIINEDTHPEKFLHDENPKNIDNLNHTKTSESDNKSIAEPNSENIALGEDSKDDNNSIEAIPKLVTEQNLPGVSVKTLKRRNDKVYKSKD